MMTNIFFRLLSAMIAIIFSWTSIVSAAPNVYKVSVPEVYGKVSQRYKGTSDKVIIHVQDAHTNFSAQKNLARVINALVTQIDANNTQINANSNSRESASSDLRAFALPFIGIEGAIGPYDFKDVREFPLDGPKDRVAAEYVKNGKLIGAEYANIIAPSDYTLYGLEDQELLRNDFRAFYAVAARQPELEGCLEVLEEQIAALKDATFPPQLKKFDASASAYEKGSTDFLGFVSELFAAIDETGIDAFQFVQLMQFKEVFLLGNTIKDDVVSTQATALADQLIAAETD